MMRICTGASLALLFAMPVLCQTERPVFDVADVQPSVGKSGDQPRGQFVNSRVDLSNVTLRLMMVAAYSLDDSDVKGGPAWFDSDRFDIVAKAPPNTKDAVLRVMLQNLLADRFKLVFHTEDHVKPVYALVVGKNGHKMQPSAPDAKEGCRNGQGDPGLLHMDCTGITMATLATFLPRAAPRWVDAPVVDQTQLKGAFDFHLDWNGRPDATADRSASDPALFSMFDAIEKIGLKLESRKLPQPLYIVDSVERKPTEQ